METIPTPGDEKGRLLRAIARAEKYGQTLMVALYTAELRALDTDR